MSPEGQNSPKVMHRLAVVTAAATYALVLLGGLVHGTGSSLACPDWPLCYGSFLPEMKGGVAVEHSHRLAAGLVSLLTAALAFVATRARRRFANLWKLAWAAFALVLVQATLGGVTVLLRLPTTVSTLHTATSLLFLLTVVYLALQSSAGAAARTEAIPAARRLALITTIIIFFQMVLGGLVRHSGAGLLCLDFPLCRGALWPDAYVTVLIHVLHRLGGVTVFVLVWASAVVMFRAVRTRGAALGWPGRLSLVTPVLVVVQLVLGVRSVQTFLDLATVESHLAVGTALLIVQWAIYLLSAPVAAAALRPEGVTVISRLRDLITLAKPRITGLVIVTFAGGLWMAPSAALIETWRVVMSMLGMALMVAAANSLNMYFERDTDALMSRTRDRPLPCGRLLPTTALAQGTALACIATPLLLLGANFLTGMLGIAAFVIYVWVYTPLKRTSFTALFVGAIPGALPPLMGWTTVSGRLDAPALVLFAILFLWQIPHFLAIALYRSDDYKNAGFQVLPLACGLPATRVYIVTFSVALLAVTALLPPLHVAGRLYAFAAVLLGVAFVAWGALGFRTPEARTKSWARSLFVASLVYLTLLFAALAANRQVI